MTPRLSRSARKFLALALAAVATASHAQVQVKDPWVRATVTQQKATGAFMQLTSPVAGQLLSASSPAAAVVEIHEMAMDGNVMKMRPLPAGLDLPAGRAVELKPGGLHIMLMDLKRPLAAGDVVPIVLKVQARGGKVETLEVKAAVRALQDAQGSQAAPASQAAHAHRH